MTFHVSKDKGSAAQLPLSSCIDGDSVLPSVSVLPAVLPSVRQRFLLPGLPLPSATAPDLAEVRGQDLVCSFGAGWMGDGGSTQALLCLGRG